MINLREWQEWVESRAGTTRSPGSPGTPATAGTRPDARGTGGPRVLEVRRRTGSADTAWGRVAGPADGRRRRSTSTWFLGFGDVPCGKCKIPRSHANLHFRRATWRSGHKGGWEAALLLTGHDGNVCRVPGA